MRKIKVVLGKNVQKRLYERFPSLTSSTQRGLIKNLNEKYSQGRLYESPRFVQNYFLAITYPPCEFLLSTHYNGEIDHYFARTVKTRLSHLESRLGKKVSIIWCSE